MQLLLFVKVIAYLHVVEKMHLAALLVRGWLRKGQERSPGRRRLERHCGAEGVVWPGFPQVLQEVIGMKACIDDL